MFLALGGHGVVSLLLITESTYCRMTPRASLSLYVDVIQKHSMYIGVQLDPRTKRDKF
jgi:hypothetical protein